MWQGHEHRRSSSSVSSRRRQPPPAPPPRSAPATCRRPRRQVGDRVFVTSPTAVFIEYRDDANSNGISGERVGSSDDTILVICAGQFAKFRNRSEVDGLEWQEVDIFIGKRSRFALVTPTLTVVMSFE